jgi:hypothetical protein
MTDHPFIRESLLGDARDWVVERIEDGVHCPCCDQWAKVYTRKLSSGIARVLIKQWITHHQEFAHTASLIPKLREGHKLAYWGLLEAEGTVRDDGGHSGRWRITDQGRLFVLDGLRVPRYARVYNGTVLELRGAEVGIQDALGDKFNYVELMGLHV